MRKRELATSFTFHFTAEAPARFDSSSARRPRRILYKRASSEAEVNYVYITLHPARGDPDLASTFRCSAFPPSL